MQTIFSFLIVFICYGFVASDTAAEATVEICLGPLGCFSITGDFYHPLYRPINFLPQRREVINTRFKLYTRENTRERHFLVADKPETITSSNFKAENPTVFIIHGFMDSELYGPWQEGFKNEFLLSGYYNVIIVDWSGGNIMPYTQAASNTRVVGAEIALLITELMKTAQLKTDSIHIIGHSLGAHIAGYAGLRIPGIGRITGLDPAEPFFQNMPITVRLDQTDAKFVDVIHSDGKTILLMGFGMNQAVGHVDFYPNNGRDQPGCKIDRVVKFLTSGLLEGFRSFVACNHQRAIDIFVASLTHRRCVPVAYNCPTWDAFLAGECNDCGEDGSKCAIVGIRANEYAPHAKNGVFHQMYLKTSANVPFCLFQYRIEVELAPKAKRVLNSGKFTITLVGTKGKFKTTLSPHYEVLESGKTMAYTIYDETDIGDVYEAIFMWSNSGLSILNWFDNPKVHLNHVRIISLNTIANKERDDKSLTFCTDPNEGLSPNKRLDLTAKERCDGKV